MSLLSEALKTHFSERELSRLAAVRVGIAGAGGLGSNAAMLLARSGVRRMRIVDGDSVAASNLNRQFYWPEDLGRPKVLALRDRLLAIEPELELEARVEWLNADSAAAVFSGCDLVLEALDDAGLKAAICSALLCAAFTVIAASGLGGYGGEPMRIRRMGANFFCVGDFTSAVNDSVPALAPRVMQAAALQADAALRLLLGGREEAGEEGVVEATLPDAGSARTRQDLAGPGPGD